MQIYITRFFKEITLRTLKKSCINNIVIYTNKSIKQRKTRWQDEKLPSSILSSGQESLYGPFNIHNKNNVPNNVRSIHTSVVKLRMF